MTTSTSPTQQRAVLAKLLSENLAKKTIEDKLPLKRQIKTEK
jgi:hypothetical protein